MSISFDITESMLFREFADTESSAISCISVLHNHVTIAYRSNTEKQYIFRASDTFASHLKNVLRWFNNGDIDPTNPDDISIGKLIAKARKSGDLEIINI